MLAARRSAIFAQKRMARYTVLILWAVLLLYVLTMSGSLALLVRHHFPTQALAVAYCAIPFFSFVDFVLRLSTQQTPTHIIKPYLLLPVPKKKLVLPVALSSLFTWGNALWVAVALPYIAIAVLPCDGLMPSLLFIIFLFVVEMINSQWYAIVRTLALRSWLWWLLPIAAYIVLSMPFLLLYGGQPNSWLAIYLWPTTHTSFHVVGMYLCMLAMLGALLYMHYILLYRIVIYELSWQEREGKYGLGKSFLDNIQRKCGALGQYIVMEWLLIWRNKHPRRLFVTASFITLCAAIYICIARMGGDTGTLTFWCVYCYDIMGAFMLVRSLGYEGNYMGLLLMKKADIYILLKAKYYFYSAYLVIPFLSLTPAMMLGKVSPQSLLALAVFTMGFQYFLIFQAIPYNKQRMTLTTAVVGKNGNENSYTILLIELSVFSCPLLVSYASHWLVPSLDSDAVLSVVGIVFVCAHKWWLNAVYRKFAFNHYEILQSFQE